MLLFSTQLDNADDINFMLNVHEQYSRLMYSKANQYLSDSSEIEDLTQDCWLKLCQHIATLKALDEKALVSYICVTVRNTAYNYKSYQSIRNRHTIAADVNMDDLYCVDAVVPSPEEDVLRKERLDNFHAGFSQLSENDQMLLEGKYILGWSDAELAEIFHCQPASIRMKLTRARQRASTLLKEGAPLDGQT